MPNQFTGLKQGYIDDKGVGHIPLTKGMWALCDAHWFHHLSQFNWYARRGHGRWYADRNISTNGKHSLQSMHRLIMGEPVGLQIDHRNGNGLDNRVENLRLATHTDNQHNRGKNRNNTSGFKGVCFDKSRNKWLATIASNGKLKNLGRFETREAAALRYNEAARILHGDFAVLNSVQLGENTI